MKEEMIKKNYTVSEMMREFEENPLYQTLSAVTGLLGEPAKWRDSFLRSVNNQLTLAEGFKEIHYFFEECSVWSNKLEIYINTLQENIIFSDNAVFKSLFHDTLLEVSAFLRSFSILSFPSWKNDKKRLDYSVMIREMNKLFKHCEVLENKVDQLVENFQKEELKKYMFNNNLD